MQDELSKTRPCNFLSFRLGGKYYACDTVNLQEIIVKPSPATFALTTSSSCWKHYGSDREIRVTDLLNRDPDDLAGIAPSLVVFGIGADHIGIIVDEISDIIEICLEDSLPVPPVISGVRSDFLRGLVEYENQEFYLIDLERIISDFSGPTAVTRAESTRKALMDK